MKKIKPIEVCPMCDGSGYVSDLKTKELRPCAVCAGKGKIGGDPVPEKKPGYLYGATPERQEIGKEYLGDGCGYRVRTMQEFKNGER